MSRPEPAVPIVLVVSDEYPPFTAHGGIATLSVNLVKMLSAKGYRAEVIAESDTHEEFTHLDDTGTLVHRVSGIRSYSFQTLRKLFPPIGRLLRSPDLLFAARVAEKVFELTTIWNRRILWVESTSWRAPTLFLHPFSSWNGRTIVRAVTPREEVVRANGDDRGDRQVRLSLGMEWLQQWLLERRLFSNAEYRPYFEERVGKRAFKKNSKTGVSLLPFDVDTAVESRAPRPSKPPTRGPIELVMIGRVEPRKGFDTICSALVGLSFEERSKLRFVIIGRDTALGPLKSYRKLLRLRFKEVVDQCFDFRGQLDAAEVEEAMAHADVGLVASTSESFGYNLVEMLARNLPVITSEVGAVQEFARRGVSYLGTFRDVEQLRQLLRALPERFAKREHRLEERQRELIREIYTDNDRSYLEVVEKEVSIRVTDLKSRAKADFGAKVSSIDLVICSYNRFDELTISIASALNELDAVQADAFSARLVVVYQNADLPERLLAWRPDLAIRRDFVLLSSFPPSLTRARNAAVRGSAADLIVFIDDDVLLRQGFLKGYVDAAHENPGAIGFAGRILSNSSGKGGLRHRAIGQIRATGFIDVNLTSRNEAATYVPQTPMGANMAYRRERMNACFGTTWFDESLTGSAIREESTLGLRIIRAGQYLVFVPHAALHHFESAFGGCNNRSKRSLRQSVDHATLEAIFLGRLHERSKFLTMLAIARFTGSEARHRKSVLGKLTTVVVGLAGAVKASRRQRSPVLAVSTGEDPRTIDSADREAS